MTQLYLVGLIILVVFLGITTPPIDEAIARLIVYALAGWVVFILFGVKEKHD